jgi:hypothetical protein
MATLAESRRSTISVTNRAPARPGNSRQADETANFGGPRTPGAELAQAGRLGRLRQLSPRTIKDETVMPIGRLRQPE